jgi:hypothetical protein
MKLFWQIITLTLTLLLVLNGSSLTQILPGAIHDSTLFRDSTSSNPDYSLSFLSNHTKQKSKHKHKINFLKTGLVTGITIGAGIWLHNYQKNAWWAGQRSRFHLQNDWDYAMSSDKIGHFFDGALIQTLYQGAFEWSGFSPKAAMWLGAGFSIIYMTDIEIEDGFASDWGFSPGDEISNIAGALYPVLQQTWTPLKEVNFKWSYYPTEDLLSGNKHGAFLDDYNGQTNWLSVGIHSFLPKEVKKFWPDFLNIAFGYGVEHYTAWDKRYQNFYIAFDFDWRKIIPGNSRFMLWIKNVLNHFRFLPAPGIRINKFKTEYSVNY